MGIVFWSVEVTRVCVCACMLFCLLNREDLCLVTSVFHWEMSCWALAYPHPGPSRCVSEGPDLGQEVVSVIRVLTVSVSQTAGMTRIHLVRV